MISVFVMHTQAKSLHKSTNSVENYGRKNGKNWQENRHIVSRSELWEPWPYWISVGESKSYIRMAQIRLSVFVLGASLT